jgi:tetratricopeptide (TPR) repeat protein
MARVAPWVGIALALAACMAPGRAGTPQGLPAVLEGRRLLDATEGPGNLDRAIQQLEAVPSGRDSAEVQVLLAEAYYDRGHDLDDRDQAEMTLDTAIAHADRALALAPSHVPARYWRAMAMLVKAGKLRGAESFGLVRTAVRDLEVVAAADPSLDDAGADRAMGKVFLDSPWWFMGDTDKAIEHLEAARKRAPESLLNRRFLAEAYAEDGREADALRELDGILNTPPRPDHAAADQREHEIARRMAEKIRPRLRKP